MDPQYGNDQEHQLYFSGFSTPTNISNYNDLLNVIKKYKNNDASFKLDLTITEVDSTFNVNYLLFILRYTENIDESPHLLIELFKKTTPSDINDMDSEFISILNEYFDNDRFKAPSNFDKKLYEAYTKFFINTDFRAHNNILSLRKKKVYSFYN